MKAIYRLFFFIVLSTILLLSQKIFSQDPNFYIFLAFGQSNMEGYPGVEEIDKKGVDSRFQLLPAVDWPDKSRTKGVWTTAIPPLCRSSTGLCPADYFGRTLVDSLPKNIKIGIINVSVAGCSIVLFDKDKYQSYIATQQDWMKNIVKEYGGNPYGRLVEMGKLAQKDGVIKGFLLHQGETDAGDSEWGKKVKIVYDNLIKDLGLDASKTPLLAGDLLSPNQNIKRLPQFLPNSYVISSEGLKGRDQYHFTAESYREFGKRYGKKMLELLSWTDISKEKYKYVITNHKNSFYRKSVFIASPEFLKGDFNNLKLFNLNGKEIPISSEYLFSKERYKDASRGIFILKTESSIP